MTRTREAVLLLPYQDLHDKWSPLFAQQALYRLQAHVGRLPHLESRFDVRVQPWSQSNELPGVYRNDAVYNDILYQVQSADPRLVAFGLYANTITACHDLATALKSFSSDTLIMAGGPEVQDRPRFAEMYPAFDILVEGEGEIPFQQSLERLSDGDRGLTGIPNVSFRRRCGEFVHNEAAAVEPLKSCPNIYARSPHLLYGEAWYMLSRGCSGGCSYCKWALQARTNTAPSIIRDELSTILASEHVEHLLFLDADFLHLQEKHPGGYEALESVFAAKERVPISVTVGMDGLVDPRLREQAEHFKAERVFLGVQSLNPASLAAVGRSWQKRHLRNLGRTPAWVRKRVVSELMVPLPEETPESFIAGLRELIQLGFYRIRTFNTLALVGTRLRVEATRLGLKHHDAPPYVCYGTPSFSTEAVLEAQAAGLVLTVLTDESGMDPERAHARLERLHGNHPNLVLDIIDCYRSSGSLGGCLRVFLEKLLAAEPYHTGMEQRLDDEVGNEEAPKEDEGGSEDDVSRCRHGAPSCEHSSLCECCRPACELCEGGGPDPEAEVACDSEAAPSLPALPRDSFPPEEAMRALVERHGLSWVDDRVRHDGYEIVARGPDGEITFRLFDVNCEEQCYGKAGAFKIMYSGSLVDVAVMDALLEHCSAFYPAPPLGLTTKNS